MKKLFARILVVAALFVAVAGPTSAVYADDSTKPGWGYGDKKHVHTGPPGHSVKNETNIKIGNWFTVMAQTGANVTVNVYNTVINNLFGNNNG